MAEHPKRIALCGISHVSNFGCEAIIRSTCAMLRECFPDCEIIYASRRADVDRRILADLPLEVRQLSRRPDLVSRVINKVFEKTRLRVRISYDRYRPLCRGLDAVVSVGGDIYTVDKQLLSIKGYRHYNRLIALEKYAKRQGAKLILYGASVGPFPPDNGNEAYFLRHLNRMDLLVCREKETIHYLKRAGASAPILLSPDPAFFLRSLGMSPGMQGRTGVAVNLSPRILFPGRPEDEQVQEIADLLTRLQETLSERLYLLPHVYSDSASDDDRAFLQRVFAHIPPQARENIVLHEEQGGFLAAKSFLAKRKMVIAARMHCAINAMSEGTPTLLISYSSKAIGMSEMIYGSKRWVIGDNALQQGLIPLAKEMLGQAQGIHDLLTERMDEICNPNARNAVKERIKEFFHE